jgi:hypothetical protein
MTIPFVQVRFYSGNTRRFYGAREEAKSKGYPDVPTYLMATGQVKAWCEEVPEEQVRTELLAEQCRLETQRSSFLLSRVVPVY